MKTAAPRGAGLWLVPLAFALVLGGAGLTGWTLRQAHAELREDLREQVIALAQQLNPRDIQALAFDASDREKPQFQRLRAQFMAYAPVARARFDPRLKQPRIYSVARREGTLRFGPESLGPEDPRAAGPGTRFERPPPGLAGLWESRNPETAGPYADADGTFVSAFAPLLDPRSGEVRLVIGLSLEASEWKAHVLGHGVAPAGFTLALLGVVLGGAWLERQRRARPVGSQPWLLRHAEESTVALAGLVLSLLLAWLADHAEQRSHQETFSRAASAQVSRVWEALWDLRDRELEGLARFCESREAVEPTKFQRYAGQLADNAAVQAWEWIPAVTAADRTRFEQRMRQDGPPGYSLWEKDREGRRVPAAERSQYYPVGWVAPVSGNEAAPGYDLGSEPVRRTALEHAARTGLPTASEPVTLVQEAGNQQGLLLFRPVYSPEPPGRLRGLVLAVLRLGTLLEKTAGMEAGGRPALAFVDLHQLATNSPPRRLASTAPPGAPARPTPGPDARQHALTVPLFGFGHAYALSAWPSAAFQALHPDRARGLVGLTGLGLTALLTGFTRVLVRRRLHLETQVQARTAELHESEARLRLAVTASDIGLWDWNLATNGVYFSPEWKGQLGYADNELPNRFEEWQSRLHPDDLAPTLAKVQQYVADPTADYLAEFRLRHRDGSYRWVFTQAQIFRDAEGHPVRMIGCHVDLTERKQAEEALHQRNEELVRFTYTVSHDLKSPLVTIQTFLGYLEKDMQSGDAGRIESDMNYIGRAAAKMLQLLEELLELSRVDRKPNPPEDVSLQTLAREAQELVAGQIAERGVRVRVTALPVVLHGDRRRLLEVFQNLLDNAVKFMGDQPSPEVEIGAEEAAGQLVLSVRDNGGGIDPRHREKLFGLFEKLHPGTPGSGIGLALVKRIVEVHGGQVWAESPGPGLGSTFRFTLSGMKRGTTESANPV